MIVVTGGAGFIGGNLVRALNQRGVDEILLVDSAAAIESRDLHGCRYAECMDEEEFIATGLNGRLASRFTAVLHHGACTDTLCTDADYLRANILEYSQRIFSVCQERRIPLVYASSASVYGAGSEFREQQSCEQPLNGYASYKLAFDEFVRSHLTALRAPVVGLRYFNVYGSDERHKGRMASMVHQLQKAFAAEGQVRLFAGSDGVGDGEQARDFVTVEDVVKVNLFFLDDPRHSGIYNVGTGAAASFNAVAQQVINTMRAARGETSLDLATMRKTGILTYFEMPASIQGRYQPYTRADIRRLRDAGYRTNFAPVRRGVADYVRRLVNEAPVAEIVEIDEKLVSGLL